MNKAVKVILNILIVIAGLAFFGLFIDMVGSFKYANREVEDPAETRKDVFEYELKHRAYNEVLGTWYVERMSSLEPSSGMEDIYNVAEYAHSAFMARVYAEKNDGSAIGSNADRMETVKKRLGDYAYTADEVDNIIKKAP